MGVPAEVRAVPRPKNTIIDPSTSDSIYKYAVRARNGGKQGEHNFQPKNGTVIGHIINGQFIKKHTNDNEINKNILSYGFSAVFKSQSDDIYNELLEYFPCKLVHSIMTLACLRMLGKDSPIDRVNSRYNNSFLKIFYRDAPVSKNSLCNVVKEIGESREKILDFFGKRINRVASINNIIIDGTLKQDTSVVNDLSKLSYRARVRGQREISIIYAYDVEKLEPLCAEVFPGNCIDAKAYSTFIRDNKINKGIIIADKGFPPSKIEKDLLDNRELHYISPIRRNDKRILEYSLLNNYTGKMHEVDTNILYKTVKTKDNKYLYSFKDSKRANEETNDYMNRTPNDNNFNGEDYDKISKKFGTIIFESDIELDAKSVYYNYKDRWLIELMFDMYKNIEHLDKTKFQSNFSVLGSEFISFISTLVTSRLIRIARQKKLLDNYTYGDIVESLSSILRIECVDSKLSLDDHSLFFISESGKELLYAYDILQKDSTIQKRKPGRPRKNIISDEQKPKRGRGRPRKIVSQQEIAPKRGRGRPRKAVVENGNSPTPLQASSEQPGVKMGK